MKTVGVFARRGALAFAWLFCVSTPAAEAHPPASQAQDSVAYQINQDHTGNIDFAGGFSGSLTQLWSVALNGTVSYPLTAKGTTFVTIGANGGALLAAVNLSTGAIVWQKLLAGSSPWADASYDDGKIFIADGTGDLIALRDSGKPLWSVHLPTSGYSESVGTPAARKGMVVVQYDNYSQNISAYDEASGAN